MFLSGDFTSFGHNFLTHSRITLKLWENAYLEMAIHKNHLRIDVVQFKFINIKSSQGRGAKYPSRGRYALDCVSVQYVKTIKRV